MADTDVHKAIAELKGYAAMGIRYHVQETFTDFRIIVPARQVTPEDLMRSVLRQIFIYGGLFDWLKGQNQRERDFVVSRVSYDPGAIEVEVQKVLIEAFNDVIDKKVDALTQYIQGDSLLNSDATDLYYEDMKAAFYGRFCKFIMAIDEAASA